jgi:hypothetical protein
LYKLKLSLIDAHVCCVLLCVGAPLVCSGPGVRRDSAGKQICELCPARISRVKHHRPHGVGRACAPRCKPIKRHSDDAQAYVRADSASSSSAAASSTTVADRPEKRARRAKSDPGEQQVQTNTRLRARTYAPNAPTSSAQTPHTKSARSSSSSSLSLDETRRLAFLASAAASASTIPSASTHM